MTDQSAIDLAVQTYREASVTLKAAQKARDEAMQEVLRLLGRPEKEENSSVTKTKWFKVTLTTRMNRSIDRKALSEIRDQLSPDVYCSVIDYQPKLILSGLRLLEKADPTAFATLSQAINVKPAKPGLKVEILDDFPTQETD